MIHNTLSALLVSVASRYAQLSPSDLGIGITGGRLVVDNVKLRANVFNGPHLPFQVQQGRAGRLRVNIPWSALSSAPVELYLENVHLIAAPKNTSSPPEKPPPDIPIQKDHWHQTLLGRLVFNVSVEMYGLKIEYRDNACNAIISVASLRAFSSDRDGKPTFVSLTSDSNSEYPHSTTAVPMRKVLNLSGVHWVMIPRTQHNQLHHEDPDNRNLDLDSYESKEPILDGISITVKVLCCTGTAVSPDSQQLTPGLHAQIDVQVEEPNINLTASQLQWIDSILKSGFGNRTNNTQVTNSSPTKRRPRSSATLSTTAETNDTTERDHTTSQPLYSETATNFPENNIVEASNDIDIKTSQQSASTVAEDIGHQLVNNANGDDRSLTDSDFDSDASDTKQGIDSKPEIQVKREGRLSSFWQAIISENSDETVDDAAVALGLLDRSTDSGQDALPNEGDEEDLAESRFAREAVNAAAKAGGLTLKLRVKTPDVAAWDLVEQLREQLAEEREERKRLENTESILLHAEERVSASEMEVQKLRERNAALTNELKDLEVMASQAGKNKDAMIRQMEAALMKAERNLQAMFQVQFEQKEAAERQQAIEREAEDNETETEEFSGTESSILQSDSRDVSSSTEAGDHGARTAQTITDTGESEVESDNLEENSTVDNTEHMESDLEEAESEEQRNIEAPIVKEMYMSKAASKELEEAISSEGLTLI